MTLPPLVRRRSEFCLALNLFGRSSPMDLEFPDFDWQSVDTPILSFQFTRTVFFLREGTFARRPPLKSSIPRTSPSFVS